MTTTPAPAPTLTPAQSAFATHPGQRIAAIAAPGAGKTLALAARVVDLVERRGVHPAQILAFAFTRAAAGELRDRVLALGGDRCALAQVTTFHAYALRILRTDPAAAGLPATFNVADDADTAAAMDSLFEGPKKRSETSRKMSKRAVWEAASHFFATAAWPPAGSPLATLLSELFRRLLERGLVVPGALPALLKVALDRSEKVRAEVVGSYQHVLVDEAHDATTVEAAIAQAAAGASGSIAMVLDPRQAIFGWRGGLGRGVLYQVAGCTVLPAIDRSHRLGRPVSAFANDVAGMYLGVEGEHPIVPREEDDSEDVEQITALELGERLASAVMEYGRDGVAILCRSNRQTLEIAEAFPDVCEPLASESTDPPWLRLAIAAARLATNHADDAAFATVYGAEHGAAAGESIHALAARAGRARSLFAERAKMTGTDAPGSLLGTIAGVDPTETPFSVLAEEASRVASPLAADPRLAGIASAGVGLLLERLGVASMDVRAALDALQTRDAADGFESVREHDRVPVSTVHSAKGREWDCVFVATSRAWPPRRADALEEWRCLFVAATRARRQLVIVAPPENHS